MGKGKQCCQKTGLKKGKWTAEEDKKLIDYIKSNGEGSWRSLPINAGLLRCGKSCRLRWINYLRDDLKRGNFTVEEEETIVKLHHNFGNRWSLIASHLPGRTDNEIKNYWNSHLSRTVYRFIKSIGSSNPTSSSVAKKQPNLFKPRVENNRSDNIVPHSISPEMNIDSGSTIHAVQKGKGCPNVGVELEPRGRSNEGQNQILESFQVRPMVENFGPLDEVDEEILMDVINGGRDDTIVNMGMDSDWGFHESSFSSPINGFVYYNDEVVGWDECDEIINLWSGE